MEFIADPFAGIPTRAPQQQAAAGEEPAVNILVLGTDSRTSASDPSQWQEGAQRTDAIMIVQVSGDRKTVSVMSIPRDSWVEIPGHGQGKINAAYSYGGPSLTIHTVENLTGMVGSGGGCTTRGRGVLCLGLGLIREFVAMRWRVWWLVSRLRRWLGIWGAVVGR